MIKRDLLRAISDAKPNASYTGVLYRYKADSLDRTTIQLGLVTRNGVEWIGTKITTNEWKKYALADRVEFLDYIRDAARQQGLLSTQFVDIIQYLNDSTKNKSVIL